MRTMQPACDTMRKPETRSPVVGVHACLPRRSEAKTGACRSDNLANRGVEHQRARHWDKLKLELQRSAFTLIELCVVLGTITLLALTLLPVLASTRPNTQATRCLDNLRQLAAGWIMYAGENDDRVMPYSSWVGFGYLDWTASSLEVEEVLDRWHQIESQPEWPRADYFKVRGRDQHEYLLKHDLESDEWNLGRKW
jgi:type II secretory pathway pseudopilin PulG